MKAIGRIFIYLKTLGIKTSHFEKKIDVSNGYLKTMDKREADLGEGVLLKIFDNCPDLNPMWVIRGEEPMLNSEKALSEYETKQMEIRQLIAKISEQLPAPTSELVALQNMMIGLLEELNEERSRLIKLMLAIKNQYPDIKL